MKNLRKVTLTYRRIRLRWITRKELILETRADNEVSGGRKPRWVTNMIPVPVAFRKYKISAPYGIYIHNLKE